MLSEKELGEEFTRILNANNPHATKNIARFSTKEGVFKTVANMEQISFHFEFDGYLSCLCRYLVYTANEDGVESVAEAEVSIAVGTQDEAIVIEGVEEETRTKQPLRNQFNYSERASQTVNNPFRVYLI